MTAQTILPANSVTDTGYEITNSCRFNPGDSPVMVKASSSSGNGYKGTFSLWVKRSNLGAQQMIGQQDTGHARVFFNGSNQLRCYGNSAGEDNAFDLASTALFRDVGAWYHIVFAWDNTQGTAANRNKVYVNGVQLTDFATETYNPQNTQIGGGFFVDSLNLTISGKNEDYFDGYMAEIVGIENTTYGPTDFGEFDEDSGIWKPIDGLEDLTFGPNGFYLDFEDSANLGNDVNGGTDFTESNLAAVDQSTDTCTNNFATLNSIDTFYVDGTLSEGNCKYVGSAGNYDFVYSTIQVSQGKWYFEGTYKDGNDDNGLIGITGKAMTDTANYLGKTATHEFSYIGNAGRTVTGGSFSTSGSYDAFTADDVIGVAMDLDNNKLYYSKNGTFQNSGDPTSGATGTGALAITAAASTTNGSYAFAVSSFDSDDADEWEVNFGNPVAALSSAATDGNGFGSFEYAPPSGYLALCTKNLATDG